MHIEQREDDTNWMNDATKLEIDFNLVVDISINSSHLGLVLT